MDNQTLSMPALVEKILNSDQTSTDTSFLSASSSQNPQSLIKTIEDSIPYLNELSSGNGKGHFLRTVVNFSILLPYHEMSFQKLSTSFLEALYPEISNPETKTQLTKDALLLDEIGVFHAIRYLLQNIKPDSSLKSLFASFASTRITDFPDDPIFSFEAVGENEFIGIVNDTAHNIAKLSQDEIDRVQKEGEEKYFTLARLLEPGNDLEEKLMIIEEKISEEKDDVMPLLLGFIQLHDKLYPEVFGRKEQSLITVMSTFTSDDIEVEQFAKEYLLPFARASLEVFRQKSL